MSTLSAGRDKFTDEDTCAFRMQRISPPNFAFGTLRLRSVRYDDLTTASALSSYGNRDYTLTRPVYRVSIADTRRASIDLANIGSPAYCQIGFMRRRFFLPITLSLSFVISSTLPDMFKRRNAASALIA